MGLFEAMPVHDSQLPRQFAMLLKFAFVSQLGSMPVHAYLTLSNTKQLTASPTFSSMAVKLVYGGSRMPEPHLSPWCVARKTPLKPHLDILLIHQIFSLIPTNPHQLSIRVHPQSTKGYTWSPTVVLESEILHLPCLSRLMCFFSACSSYPSLSSRQCTHSFSSSSSVSSQDVWTFTSLVLSPRKEASLWLPLCLDLPHPLSVLALLP